MHKIEMHLKQAYDQEKEHGMKKKGHPNIPDFSTKRVVPVTADTKVPKVQPPHPMPQTGVKPHATSKKSGRRGS
jgi:hypothetical protein